MDTNKESVQGDPSSEFHIIGFTITWASYDVDSLNESGSTNKFAPCAQK